MLDSANILLADDKMNDVELLRAAFARSPLNASVHTVKSGHEVIQYLEGNGPFHDRLKYPLPRLVLLDLDLPGVSGWQVLEWIRQRPLLKRLPVIVFTGSDREKDIDKAYELGANSYLVKPPDLHELIEAVKQISEFWLRTSRLPTREPLSQPQYDRHWGSAS
jgi:CheY-like chemotaxis protein